MFTGIVEHTGKITAAEPRGDMRVRIACDFDDLVIGESVAVNGVCLTVVDTTPSTINHQPSTAFLADVSAETLKCTAPCWEVGKIVNLERALRLGDALSGHMVTGHVDGVAKLLAIAPSGDSQVWELEAPAVLARFIAEKGSVTLDGVSLTVNKVEGARFFVNIIPHTALRTTFHTRHSGDGLNLEIDIIARYVERLAQ